MSCTPSRARTWHVTVHAAERYIQRHDPSLDLADAKATLCAALETARPLKERSRAGDPRWLIGALDVVAIVKEEPTGRHVVTIEPAMPEDIPAEEEAALVEAAAKLPNVTLAQLRAAPAAVREDLIARAAEPKPEPMENIIRVSAEEFTRIEAMTETPPTPTPALVDLMRRQRPAAPTSRRSEEMRLEEIRADNLRRELQLATVRMAQINAREKTERMRIHERSDRERLKEALRVAVVALDDASRAFAMLRAMLGNEHVDGLLEVHAKHEAARAAAKTAEAPAVAFVPTVWTDSKPCRVCGGITVREGEGYVCPACKVSG